MKRLHVHVAVDELDPAIAFYSGLFGAAPTVRKSDYAKWMLDDPRVNFAISQRGRASGLDHLGIQVESREELAAVQQQFDAAGLASFAKGAASCCYAKSEKTWTRDPAGIAWETFFTSGEATTYGGDAATPAASARPAQAAEPKSSCCAPADAAPGSSASSCC
jgi:catechol 2,3-dioxygenase-like lactoylglutathione lyase family enzyme